MDVWIRHGADDDSHGMDGLVPSERDRSRDKGRAGCLWEWLEGFEVYDGEGHESWECGKRRGVALDQGRGYFDGGCRSASLRRL